MVEILELDKRIIKVEQEQHLLITEFVEKMLAHMDKISTHAIENRYMRNEIVEQIRYEFAYQAVRGQNKRAMERRRETQRAIEVEKEKIDICRTGRI